MGKKSKYKQMLSKNMAKIMNFYTESGGIKIKTTIEIEKRYKSSGKWKDTYMRTASNEDYLNLINFLMLDNMENMKKRTREYLPLPQVVK